MMGRHWALLCLLALVAAAEQQQQQQRQADGALQAQLSAAHSQAQRTAGQLGGLLAASAAGQQQGAKLAPVLEALSSVGQAIQQQMGGLQIVSGDQAAAQTNKNAYQVPGGEPAAPNSTAPNQRETGEHLRQDIMRRAGQLQQVVASSMELLRNSGDLIVRRLLDQMNARLEQAKARADRILSEPSAANNEVAVKALSAINLGLNNLNNMITSIVARLDAGAKQQQQAAAGGAQADQQQRAGPPPAPDAQQQTLARLRANLGQLGQQFQSALNASQLSPLLRQRQHQLQQMLASAGQPPPVQQQH